MKRTSMLRVLLTIGATVPFLVHARTITLNLPGGGSTYWCFGVGDLNGDGAYDFVTKYENGTKGHDPSSSTPSNVAYKVHAFKSDGTFMWGYNVGKGIEQGTHYSPVLAYDVDMDGRAEVYLKDANDPSGQWPGRITQGEEWLVKLDPLTGTVVKKVPWIPRSGNYNDDARNYIAIAYLDGKTPSVICSRGTYSKISVWAYDKDLNVKWQFTPSRSYCGRHTLMAADVDEDGKDEVILGTCVVDDNGRELWNIGGHADALFVGDLNWSHPGVEIALGLGEKSSGIGMVDGKTGSWIWKVSSKNDGQGMIGDVSPQTPGIEFYASADAEHSVSKFPDGRAYGFFTAEGKTCTDCPTEKLPNRAVAAYRDGTGKEVVLGVDAPDGWAVDIMGDWREEIVKISGTTLTINTPDGEPVIKRPSLMTNRQYRIQQAMGNWMVGYRQHFLPSGRIGSATEVNPVELAPATLPGKLEAEDYTAMKGIQTETTRDAGGGLNVGWIDAGDWLEYQVMVASTGTYAFAYRVASTGGSGQLELLVDGTAAHRVAIPNTGGWQSWTTVTATAELQAGTHTLRIAATGPDWNFNCVEVGVPGATAAAIDRGMGLSEGIISTHEEVTAIRFSGAVAGEAIGLWSIDGRLVTRARADRGGTGIRPLVTGKMGGLRVAGRRLQAE